MTVSPTATPACASTCTAKPCARRPPELESGYAGPRKNSPGLVCLGWAGNIILYYYKNIIYWAGVAWVWVPGGDAPTRGWLRSGPSPWQIDRTERRCLRQLDRQTARKGAVFGGSGGNTGERHCLAVCVVLCCAVCACAICVCVCCMLRVCVLSFMPCCCGLHSRRRRAVQQFLPELLATGRKRVRPRAGRRRALAPNKMWGERVKMRGHSVGSNRDSGGR